MLAEQGLDRLILERLGMQQRDLQLDRYHALLERIRNPRGQVEVALVGKYISLGDAYKSVNEALAHGGFALEHKVRIRRVSSEELRRGNVAERLGGVHGIVVPGGFGDRGIEGKIEAIRWARQENVPFLGLCLGMQCAVIEFARNVAGLEGAHSLEFDEDAAHPVIALMADQEGLEKGGTMRLGGVPLPRQGGHAFACALRRRGHQ